MGTYQKWKKIHTAAEEDIIPLRTPAGIRYIQQLVWYVLYYARATYNTIHPAFNEIGSQQPKWTQATNHDVNILMNYLYKYFNAKLRYYKSNMQLYIDSNAAYLVAPEAKNRVAGYYHISDKQSHTTQSSQQRYNITIHI